MVGTRERDCTLPRNHQGQPSPVSLWEATTEGAFTKVPRGPSSFEHRMSPKGYVMQRTYASICARSSYDGSDETKRRPPSLAPLTPSHRKMQKLLKITVDLITHGDQCRSFNYGHTLSQHVYIRNVNDICKKNIKSIEFSYLHREAQSVVEVKTLIGSIHHEPSLGLVIERCRNQINRVSDSAMRDEYSQYD